ncbi:MAG: MFS transporter [Kiritimatiellia bacterium]
MARPRSSLPVLFTLACALGGGLFLQRDRIPESFSLSRAVPFEKLSKAARGADGSFAVVFDSNKRIARVGADGALIYLVPARNDPEKGFFFANEIAFDPDGRLYVASTYIDTATLTVNREAVVRFSPEGRPEGVLYSIAHAPEPYVDNIGTIRSLQWTPDGLRFCRVGADGIHSLRVDANGGGTLEETVTPLAHAEDNVLYATVSADGRELAYSTAATEIYVAPPGQAPAKRYDGRDLPDEVVSIPSDLHYRNIDLYFSDLGRDAIMRLRADHAAEPLFDAAIAAAHGYADDFYECKSFQLSEDHLVLPNNGKAVEYRTRPPAAIQTLDRAQGNVALWARRAAIWLQLAAFAGLVLALVVLAIRHASPDGRRMAKQVALVALMIGTAVGITTYMIFNNLSRRLDEEARNNLRGYLEVGRLVVDAEAVDRIQHVKHYMNADYQAVLRQLCQTITREGAIDASTYSGVYKVFGDKLSALAYHDGLRGIFYPYDYQYAKSIYAQVAETGQPYVGEVVDIYGVWLNGVIPLVSTNGATVGLLEVGVDQSAQREANRALFKSTLMDLAMVLFVLLFVFFEIGFFSSHVMDRADRASDAAWQRYDEGALRFTSFLAIAGVFLSASFLPLHIKSLAPAVGRFPDLIIGLPMAIETLCGALVAVLYGHVRIRAGLKTDVVLGGLVIGTGMVATGLAPTYELLIAGRVLVGMGMGLLMIAFRTYFLIEKDEGKKESGIIALTAGVIAGINVGSVSGGMLAARIGMRPVFGIQAALLVLAAVAALALVRNRRRAALPSGPAAAAALSPWAFLRERAVWSFFVFIFLPVTACGLFLGFLFPLFAEAQGCTINEISLAFMLFGAASVYLGPALTRLTTVLFGARRAMPVGALIMTGALLLFAAFQSLAAAYATIVLFGLTESMIFNQGLSYYSSLPSVRRFGEDKAMGIYNVFESGGEALGPMVFGLAASLSLGLGIATIAATLGVGAAIFWALGPRAGGGRP